MNYKVCITTAGIGSRLGKLTKNYNKSLISINNKPIISYIIDSFKKSTEFVVAIGYLGEQVRLYLSIAHPDNKFKFVKVKNYIGPGSGLGHTLLCCEKHLNTPFIYIACDSYFTGTLLKPNYDWIGYCDLEPNNQFRSINLNKNIVESINEKKFHLYNSKTYTGIAGVNNYKIFWKSMKLDVKKTVNNGEVEGLKGILKQDKSINGKKINWYDLGNIESLHKTREKFALKNNPNILEKDNEAIWFVNNNVIKYSSDSLFIKERIARSKLIKNFVPKIISSNKQMYKYKKISGSIFSEICDLEEFKNLLKCCQKFWDIKKLSSNNKKEFYKNCYLFYKKKSLNRINLFLKKYPHLDKIKKINGIKCPSIYNILNSIDWNSLSKGLPARMHGDLHFENILLDKNKKFVFLDWRQNFSGNLKYGDLYYDLAKLMHGLIVSHKIVSQKLYSVKVNTKESFYNLHRLQIHVDYENFYCNWLKKNNYDINKVYILTSLIFLNIATLHHYPYSLLLFLLGKKMLFENLSQYN